MLFAAKGLKKLFKSSRTHVCSFHSEICPSQRSMLPASNTLPRGFWRVAPRGRRVQRKGNGNRNQFRLTNRPISIRKREGTQSLGVLCPIADYGTRIETPSGCRNAREIVSRRDDGSTVSRISSVAEKPRERHDFSRFSFDRRSRNDRAQTFTQRIGDATVSPRLRYHGDSSINNRRVLGGDDVTI